MTSIFKIQFNWLSKFLIGFVFWLFVIALGLIALKGNVEGFGTKSWWWQTGSVYLLWGFLNYIIFFVIAYFIIPYGLPSKKIKEVILLTFLLIICIGVVKYGFVSLKRFDYVKVSYFKNENPALPVYFSFFQYLQKTFITGIFVSILAFSFGLTINWVESEKLRIELEEKRKEAELAFLRMQINPHFLFNSLNSIYSLSLNKNKDAPKVILKLSEMMRYMLYENEDKSHKVELKKEIAYLKNYIALQEIRFRNAINIDFNITGNPEDKKIVPLLLIPFVENGFKHGSLENEDCPLKIMLQISDDQLLFEVSNKINTEISYLEGGIGLQNVQRRLTLLYPNKHELKITSDAQNYNVVLKILF